MFSRKLISAIFRSYLQEELDVTTEVFSAVSRSCSISVLELRKAHPNRCTATSYASTSQPRKAVLKASTGNCECELFFPQVHSTNSAVE